MQTRWLCGIALGTVLALGAGRPAAAATLCVNPGGTAGCHASIGAAVTAAADFDTIAVQPGIYDEDVIIKKPLALVGAGAGLSVINATGQANGIYVDGIDTPHLARVAISGFTVENAKYEGILVANASDVTIYNNRVAGNDLGLTVTAGTPSCPGQPAFETAESDDCGEGIHLLGADHAVVSQNTVADNSGGILLSDDTGPAHDNVIGRNLVAGNAEDCGITLASHPASNGAKTSWGVFRNTVVSNTSTHNGTRPPGGAGVGLFTSVPGAATYANAVVSNTITDNGIPGVAMHSHSPGQNLTENKIIGNTISGNGADTEDAATAGPTGINVYAVSPATGTVISGNIISGESIDFASKTGAPVEAHLNQFLSGGTGITNLGTGLVDATLNWWGCAGGPPGSGCSGVTGTRVLSVPALSAP